MILLLGPLKKHKNDPVGGIVVLFHDFINYCEKNNISHLVIDTNKNNYTNRLFAFFFIIFKILFSIKKCTHISLHGTAADFFAFGPFIILLGQIFDKKTSMRKFAGSFHQVYNKSNIIKKSVYKLILSGADFVFFETKFLKANFEHFNPKTFWLPNSRILPSNIVVNKKKFSKKILFLSQVKKTKGIYELIEAAEILNDDYKIDVYGPLMMDTSIESRINRITNMSYKGIVEPFQVYDVIKNYDILVLPTFHDGEGYPGVIIEAFACGIPVISTKWNAIPEMITDWYNGFLIDIKSSEKLVEAILLVNKSNYPILSSNAYKSSDDYSTEKVLNNFFLIINNN